MLGSGAELIKRAVHVGPPGAALTDDVLAVDWSGFIPLAAAHGVLGLVARSLKARDWAGVPPGVVKRLVDYRTRLAAQNMFSTRRLLRILDLLGAHGIPALPYKGPVLAACAYGDVTVRPFSDLDLLVRAADVHAARTVLLGEGYVSLSPRTDAASPDSLPPGHALPLRSPDGRTVVELHWKLTPTFPLAAEELLRDTVPFPLLDSTVPGLVPDRLLLVLCVHGAKHAWERLEWITSVAHLVSACPDLDWARLQDDARALDARRSVALGLALASGVAGAPVPGQVMRTSGASRLAPLATAMERRILRDAPNTAHPLARYWLRLRTADRRERTRYLLFLRRPTDRDRAFVPLPPRLSFLYAVVRPVRILAEHGPGKGRREHAGARVLARQLDHQAQKAAALQGREDEVVAAMALHWDRVARRLRRAGLESDDPRILEVGSGAHGLVFGSGSARAVGVDPLAASYASLFPVWQRRVPTVAALGERLPFASGAFDVVLCDNVVDHGPDPAGIVAELARVLVPGGFLYFTVNVHHRLYSVVGKAHRAWNAAGVPLEIGPFADHTVHLAPAEARLLFRGLPLDFQFEKTYLVEAKERARRRPVRHPGHLLPWIFFKNARYQVVARRR